MLDVKDMNSHAHSSSTRIRNTREIRPCESKQRWLPRLCTLEGFGEEVDRRGGMDLSELEPLTRLKVRTLHALPIDCAQSLGVESTHSGRTVFRGACRSELRWIQLRRLYAQDTLDRDWDADGDLWRRGSHRHLSGSLRPGRRRRQPSRAFLDDLYLGVSTGSRAGEHSPTPPSPKRLQDWGGLRRTGEDSNSTR